MSDQQPKAVLGFGVDTTEAEQGVDRLERRIGTMAQNVAQAGEKAGAGVGKIGDGVEAAAKTTETATSKMSAAIKRLSNEQERLAAGPKGSSQYLEVQARQMGANVEAIKPLLAQLDLLRDKNALAATALNASAVSMRGFLNAAGGLAGIGVLGIAGVTAAALSLSRGLFDASVAAERLRIGLDFASGGNGRQELAYVTQVSNKLGLSLLSTADAYTKFAAAARGTALEGAGAKGVFESVAKASAVMGLSADQSAGALLALQQMISKGTVQAEELRGQLGERLPGAFQIAARAMGVTTQELGKLLETGQVIAADFLPKFASQLEKEIGGGAEKAANRLGAAVNRMETALFRLKTALGDSGVASVFAGALNAKAGLFDAIATDVEKLNTQGPLRKAASDVIALNREVNALRGAMAAGINSTRAEAQLATLITKLEAAKQRFRELDGADRNAGMPPDVRSNFPGQGSRATFDRQQAEARKKAEEELIGVRQRLLGVDASYLKDLNALQAAMKAGILTEKEYVAQVSELATATFKKSEAGKALSKSDKQAATDAKAATTQYAELSLRINERIALSDEELRAGRQLTEAEKQEIKVRELLDSTKSKVNAAQRAAILANLEEAKSKEVLVIVQRSELALAQQIANTRQSNRNTDYTQSEQAIRDIEAARAQSLASVKDQTKALEDEAKAAALSTGKNIRLAEAVEMVAIARLEEKRASFVPGSEGYEAIEREIEARRKLLEQVSAKSVRDEWKQASDDIYQGLSDSLQRGFEDGKDFAEGFFDSVTAMAKRLVIEFAVKGTMSLFGGGPNDSTLAVLLNGQSGGGNSMLGMANNASTLNSIYGAGAQFFTGGTAGASGASLAYANGLGMVGGDSLGGLITANGGWAGVSSGAGAATGASFGVQGIPLASTTGAGTIAAGSAAPVAGASSTSGMLAAAAPYLAIAAIAIYGAYENTRGETRSGGQYGYSFDGTTAYNPRRGASVGARGYGATLLEGPSGGDASAANNVAAINATVAGINGALNVLGIESRLTGYQAAYESSERSRGGVFAGGTLSNGVRFGESGMGTNVDARGPYDSLYEQWGPNGMALDNGGNADLDGSVQELMTDMQQSYIEAIQASVGLLPRIVEEHFTEMVSQAMGDSSPELNQVNHTRYLRVYDEATRESIRTLGLLPKKIADLVLDVDPETLSAEATSALTTRIATLISNVDGFRKVVDQLPVEQLRTATFDIAAGLIEMAGGVENFARNLTSYADNFYSEEEKRQKIAQNIVTTLNAAGVDFDLQSLLGTSREGFRKIAEGLNLTTEEGQRSYTALMSVAGAFASITPSAEEVAREAREKAEDEARKTQQRLAETAGLEMQLLRLQGNTAEVRRRELEALLSDASRDTQSRIWAVEDERANAEQQRQRDEAAAQAQAQAAQAQAQAAQAAQQAYEAAMQAAESARESWRQTAKSIEDSMRELRGELPGNKADTLASAQTRFSIASAQTRAGDQQAADSLPELAKAVQELALGASSTQLDYARIVAATLASLDLTLGTIRPRAGLPSYDVGTAYVPQTGPALIHQGEAILPAPVAQRWRESGGNQELVAEVRALQNRLAEIENNTSETARFTGRTDKQVQEWSREGVPIKNQPGTVLA